eukprot:14963478-Ditylum_brightwellii.AAC.1
MVPLPDETPVLPKEEKTCIQQVLGLLLFYAQAVDPTRLLALNAIATQQEHPTSKTTEAITKLLNYAVTHPDAILRYHASDMVLHIHSDASYLSALRAWSRAGGHFFLSKRPPDTSKPGTATTLLNSAVHSMCKLLRNVMALAAEAK